MSALPPSAAELPVHEALPALRRALADPGAAVLTAPPGAGKTTIVPLALLGEPWLRDLKIVLLEPRRLAARAAAYRMADLLGEEAGGTVGYRVRLDTRVSARTRIEVVTEGVLTRMLQADPALEGVGLAVFDEFHERSVHADLGLALALQSKSVLRPDLRLLVMSATLDAGPVAALLDGAPAVRAEGRQFPVETRWLAVPVEGWIEPAASRVTRQALMESEGDVLVFLPGAAEIHRTAERLADADLPPGTRVVPLYGNLSRQEQDAAIAPSPPGQRKVVLATSIAETSLTIEGVRVVVDAGLMRVPRFDPGRGMTRLETVRVTRDAADQRRGRAGRVAAGTCWRLWTEAEERGLVPRRTPEILETDLAPLALELAAWGAPDPSELRWLDPPAPAAYAQARDLLRELEALDDEGALTAHGRRMARLSLHPRLAHMLLRARSLGLPALGAELAALLDERDPLRAEGRPPDADARLRVEALRAFIGSASDDDVSARRRRSAGRGGGRRASALPPGHRADRGALARAARETRHWRERLGVPEAGPDDVVQTGLLLAFAYPDRLARRRPGERGRYVLRNRLGAALPAEDPLAGEEWLAVAGLLGRGAEARILLGAPLERAEVEEHFAGQARQAETVEWDAEAGLARGWRRRTLGALVLDEAQVQPDPGAAAAVLLEALAERGLAPLPWTRETEQLRDRLRFLHGLDPDGWPNASHEALIATAEAWLLPFLAGMRGLRDLERLDLSEALLSRVPWERRSLIDELAPARLEVPTGSRIAIDYSDPEAPSLAVRLQEVFGVTETPRIAGGRVPLTIELLSPARRPVQVTRDLASFWRDAYFEVRKEMRGRYPKHHWPEDPLAAEPTRGVKRRG